MAATAELVDLTSPVERGKILGFNDLLSGLLGATLALLGGFVLSAVGLVGLGVAGLVLTVVPVLLILKTGPPAVRSTWSAEDEEHLRPGKSRGEGSSIPTRKAR